jgi:hypothetical protein
MDRLDPYLILDLTPYFNNDGISSDADRGDGDFNGTGATYPEEDLPASGSLIACGGVVFQFPDKGHGLDNNISLDGQRIPVPQNVYDGLYLLGASDNSDLEDVIRLIFADGSQEPAYMGLSGWGKGHHLRYGERVAVQCSGYHFPSKHVYTDRVGVHYGIWMQRVPIPGSRPLAAVVFPENPGMRVFAMTLCKAEPRASQEER